MGQARAKFFAANVGNETFVSSHFLSAITHLATGASSQLLLQQVPAGSDGASPEESGGRGGFLQAAPAGRELLMVLELARKGRRHWLSVLHFGSSTERSLN